MSIYYLIVVIMVGSTPVPSVQGRTLEAADCLVLAARMQEAGYNAFCAVETLTEPQVRSF